MAKRKRLKKPSRKSPSKRPFKFTLSISQILIAIGILFLTCSILLKIHAVTRLSFQGAYTNSNIQSGKISPKKIVIPKIDLILPVYKTKIVNGTWQVADNGASYLENSSGINQKNSAIIYNHNTKGKFDHLSRLKPGDTIVIEGSDRKIYVYKVRETKIVDPTDIGILTEDKSENLILYTCYGFADLKRFVVKAVPSN